MKRASTETVQATRNVNDEGRPSRMVLELWTRALLVHVGGSCV